MFPLFPFKRTCFFIIPSNYLECVSLFPEGRRCSVAVNGELNAVGRWWLVGRWDDMDVF